MSNKAARALRRKSGAQFTRDPRLPRAASWSFGGRWDSEVDKLASCNPFFMGGTHRAEYGNTLLHNGRLFDRKTQDELQKVGRHWKATPGPGTYRTQVCISAEGSGQSTMAKGRISREPSWGFGTGPQSHFLEDMNPDPCAPGPGRYKTWTAFRPDNAKTLPTWATAACNEDVIVAPNLPRSVSQPIGTRTGLDQLASCNPMYQSGTHRAEHGELLLTNGRLRDDKTWNTLFKQGRHWKAQPGAGTYRTATVVGDQDKEVGAMNMSKTRINREPHWKFGTGPQSRFMEDMNPDPCAPGPGRYTAFCDIDGGYGGDHAKRT